MKKLYFKQQGVSLIELIIFLVVAGIAAYGIITSYQFSLTNAPKIEYNNQATALAQQRMALILGNKDINGFASFSDPCTLASPPAICTTKSGYTVSSTISSSWNSNSNLKQVTVNVTGLGSASLTTLVGNY